MLFHYRYSLVVILLLSFIIIFVIAVVFRFQGKILSKINSMRLADAVPSVKENFASIFRP